MRIRRRWRALARPSRGSVRRRSGSVAAGADADAARAVGHVCLAGRGLGLGPAAGPRGAARVIIADDDVCDAGAALGLVDALVLVVGEFRDNIPGVEDSWDLLRGKGRGQFPGSGGGGPRRAWGETDHAKAAEEDVDDGVGGADATLDPD